MSFAKRAIVEDERKYSAAIRVALRAGELERCDLICEQVFERHSKDTLKSAYRIGNNLISIGDQAVQPFKGTATDRKQLSAILENLWTEFPDKCRCRSLAYED
jgi:hypothetical protein